MKSICIAILLTVFAMAASQGQSTPIQHEDAFSPSAVMRIKALQGQINKQQIEINVLRSRLGKLQDAFQELADMVADQTSDEDDDDLADDSDVSGFVVNSPSSQTKREAGRIRRSALATCSNRTPSHHECRASLKKSTIQ